MAGKPGRSGGARAGAGQKKRTTVEEQNSRRDIVLSVFNPDEFRQCVEVIRDEVKAGRPEKMYPLLPYLLGSAKQEISHSQDGPFRIIIETVPDRGNDNG